MKIDRKFTTSGGAKVQVSGGEFFVTLIKDSSYLYSATSLIELANFLKEVAWDMEKEIERLASGDGP